MQAKVKLFENQVVAEIFGRKTFGKLLKNDYLYIQL